MKRLCELLNETILQMKENVEKKQALTYEEMEAEREEHTPIEQLDKKHFAKGSRTIEQNGGAAVSQQAADSKDIALKEANMKRLCELLNETILQTKENVEKKQALTYEEMEAEREEEEIQADSESDDEEQQIYNPLKLPMGWDGKPIPQVEREQGLRIRVLDNDGNIW